ncbi:MMPL family transporter [Actinomadura sp. 1N219]|uniref:MMPL family transporter n=1 Tax=Actinomadura sp. 1N219 TaxID=3375152 RepID=UPI003797896B
MTLTEETPTEAVRPPAGVFARVAGFAHRRRWLVLVLWVAVLAGVWGAASVTGTDYRNDYSLPGTESQEAADLLAEHGLGRAGDTMQIVLSSDAGLNDPATRRQVEAMLAEVAAVPKIAEVRSPYADPSAIAPGGRIGYATAVLEIPSKQMTKPDSELVYEAAAKASRDGLQVELGGEAARLLAASEGGAAEGVGLLAAMVVLVLMFGTFIAAGLPIMTAVFAVGSTLGAIVLASHVFTIAEWTPYVMILVGLGVGIDYALLVFARYRGELVKGTPPGQAAVAALDVAGRTVFFAGCTVILALLGLVALGLGSLQGMALSVALTVLVTMLASLTLLPALLGVFGKRFARQFTERAARRAAKGKAEEGALWRRVGVLVQRRPMAALLVAGVLLGALAVPALGMRFGFADAGNDPRDTTSREAYDLLSQGFGPGFNGPLLLVVQGGEGGPAQAGAAVSQALRDVGGVKAAGAPVAAPDGRIATMLVFPASSPQAEETTELVSALRDDVLPGVSAQTGANVLVGGATAAAEDYSAKVADRMPLFMAIVVGLSVVLLMAVFRSVLIPLKAALLNLLSIGAALGAMKLVFQDGRFGADAAPIEAYLPVMVFAIVFGLSMDYEIFLVSRMREEWLRTGDAAHAVREGLAHTGSVITAAGAIMVVVFGAFMLSPERLLQQTGFGMAVAVFVDAVIIRCLIVPAVMRLLGRHAWWFPRPLDRLLPNVQVEKA